MKAYVDTNVLVRLHLESDRSAEALAMVGGASARRSWPFPVTTLLRMEVLNALERHVFESREGSSWRVSPEGAAAARGNFEEDLIAGVWFRPVPLSLEKISGQFDSLVARHTAKHGFRTYNMLHVASALHLGCDTFWSFDAKARKLAKLEGLETNK